jgi:uncharacterized protein DUF3761
MRLATALAALALLATGPALARDYRSDPSSHGYYHSTDGSTVHGPTRRENAAYGRVTADCRDGTHSYSHHHSGTCSGHGGVANWR